MNGRAGSRLGTHNAPIFSVWGGGGGGGGGGAGGSFPWPEKENVCNWIGVGNSVLLMLVCSNVRMTKECSIFGVTFDAAI